MRLLQNFQICDILHLDIWFVQVMIQAPTPWGWKDSSLLVKHIFCSFREHKLSSSTHSVAQLPVIPAPGKNLMPSAGLPLCLYTQAYICTHRYKNKQELNNKFK